MKAIIFTLFVIISTVSQISAKQFSLESNFNKFVDAVIHRENPRRNPDAIGDKHLQNKAYGILQIRNPYISDVNKIAGKKILKKKWGKNVLTVKDMKELKKAKWAFKVYLSHYGKLYKKKTGKSPSAEVYARIHNDGPNGWKKNTTVSYGKAVVKYIQANKSSSKRKLG